MGAPVASIAGLIFGCAIVLASEKIVFECFGLAQVIIGCAGISYWVNGPRQTEGGTK